FLQIDEQNGNHRNQKSDSLVPSRFFSKPEDCKRGRDDHAKLHKGRGQDNAVFPHIPLQENERPAVKQTGHHAKSHGCHSTGFPDMSHVFSRCQKPCNDADRVVHQQNPVFSPTVRLTCTHENGNTCTAKNCQNQIDHELSSSPSSCRKQDIT